MTPSATPLERAVDASIACLAAWAYPSDDLARETALLTCSDANIDYIEMMATLTEQLDAVQYRPENADRARREIAKAVLNVVDQLAAKMNPRHGIMADGNPVDDADA